MVRVGNPEKNGIFGSGVVDFLEKGVYQDFNKTKKFNIMYGKLNVLLHPYEDKILTIKELKAKIKDKDKGQRWEPQSSSIEIEKADKNEFLRIWVDFLNKKHRGKYKNLKKEHLEGSIQQRLYTYNERNSLERDECIKKSNYICNYCKKSMTELYGESGKYIMHVHDKNCNNNAPKRNEKIKLIPLCPNCHSICHLNNK